ncbi:MAG: ATP-binding cassette domain-containing protein [Crocinitomicaceae bacterium]|nr:ATP-binding cassette domain-containing protein [Crocinitomicaceae bacterium]
MISIEINKRLVSSDQSFDLDIEFSGENAQIFTIFGPSGSGKTTFLRLLAGLDKPDNGKILFANEEWFNSKNNYNLPPQERSIGFVFQDYALFPNMSVRQNLEFAMKKNESDQIINELIDLVELSDLMDRKPNSLSGGQKQRVALARAIVQKPKVLLLDEPFAALDDQIRSKLLFYLKQLHEKYQFTIFMVSHQLSDIYHLSQQIICLDKGKIMKMGSFEQVFLDNNISGKLNIFGEVVSVEPSDVIYRVNILSQNNLFSVIVTEELQVGDKVMLATKAFNPIVIKVENK